MALSDYEKEVLAEMEAQLKQADPKLASVMTSSLPKEDAEQSGRLSPRRIALGSIIAIIGLAVVVVGVSFGFGVGAVLLGILGFVLMVGGVLWALKPDKTVSTSKQDNASKKKSKRGDSGSFMDKQKQRWERRNNS